MRAQLTDEAKINLKRSAFIPPQIRFFQEKSKGIAVSHKVACTCGGASGDIFGVPVYAPFLRLDTIINGQIIESVNQYNQVTYMYVNCNTDVAGKAGV